MKTVLVDIHCHILPGIDDGARDWDVSLEMARVLAADGVQTVIATPHQLGNFASNDAVTIRQRVEQLRDRLAAASIPLAVLAGGDVRIEATLCRELAADQVLSLGDHRRHVLLELPHELYFPLEPLLADLARMGLTGILSHPERNQGILREPHLVKQLVENGCLMQVTAGSLLGSFGPAAQTLSEQLLREGLIHFIATDAHGATRRRPRLGDAFRHIAALTDENLATRICGHNPARVAAGQEIPPGPMPKYPLQSSLRSWFSRRKSA